MHPKGHVLTEHPSAHFFHEMQLSINALSGLFTRAGAAADGSIDEVGGDEPAAHVPVHQQARPPHHRAQAPAGRRALPNPADHRRVQHDPHVRRSSVLRLQLHSQYCPYLAPCVQCSSPLHLLDSVIAAGRTRRASRSPSRRSLATCASRARSFASASRSTRSQPPMRRVLVSTRRKEPS